MCLGMEMALHRDCGWRGVLNRNTGPGRFLSLLYSFFQEMVVMELLS